jgi:hypothetical protein
MRATLVGQNGSRKPPLRPRRTNQRPDYLKLCFLPRRSAHFQKRVFLMISAKTQPYVVILFRPAPSFDQSGLLASTVCTFLRRLMLIVFGCFLNNCAPLQREAPFGSPGMPPGSPRRPSGEPAPKGSPEALHGNGLGRLGLSLGGLRAPFGKPPGPHRHPKVAPGTGPI